MASTQKGPVTSDEKVDDPKVPEMPSHWDFERYNRTPKRACLSWHRFVYLTFRFLCVLGFGSGNLHRVWEASYPGCSVETSDKERDKIRQRLEHLNLVSALLLSAMAVFCTTIPPTFGNDMKQILPYTDPFPYVVLLVSVALALGGLIVGSTAVFTLHNADLQWFRQKMMGSRIRVWATTIILSVPCLSVAATIGTASAGLIIAASKSDLLFVRIACYFLASPALMCGLVFLVMLF